MAMFPTLHGLLMIHTIIFEQPMSIYQIIHKVTVEKTFRLG